MGGEEAHFFQRLSCNLGCFHTALTQNLINFRNMFFQFLSANANRFQFFLHNVIQETFYFHIAKTSPAIMVL